MAGRPTTITRETVYPIAPAPTVQVVPVPGTPEGPTPVGVPGEEPASPEFTGGASAMEALGMFGGVRAGLVAGGMGLMGLVFAEL